MKRTVFVEVNVAEKDNIFWNFLKEYLKKIAHYNILYLAVDT